MTSLNEDSHARTPWSRWRTIAVALIVAGAILPPMLTSMFRSIWQPLAEAIGISIIVAGFALLIARAHRDISQQVKVLTGDMRNLTDQVERYSPQVEIIKHDVAAFEKMVDGERRNLGMVAGGLGEMRQIVHLERRNLGNLAEGLDEIRKSLRAFHDALQQARGDAQGAVSGLASVAVQVTGIIKRQDDLEGKIGVERLNLGMVAGALDDLRRLTAGVHLFDSRQAAFEDTLIQIADRIDLIGVDSSISLSIGATGVDPEQLSALPGMAPERGE